MIRWMSPTDEPFVRALAATCHPGEPARPEHFYPTHPTLVIPAATSIIASASFLLAPREAGGYVAYGFDLCVHPNHRGKGLATRLHAERCEIAKSLGAVDFVGTTKHPHVERIFDRAGMKAQSTVLPDGSVIWIGGL